MADAFGGGDSGLRAGDAFSGRAFISSRTALSPNETGSTALDELEFLSSEAFGGKATSGRGGNANTNEVRVLVLNGTTINLPDVVGYPLLIHNTALGGSTSANDSFAGTASLGQIRIELRDQGADLDRLSVISTGIGGSVIGDAERSRGEDAFGGSWIFQFGDTTLDVAFDEISLKLIGVQAPANLLGIGGSVLSNSLTFNVANSTLIVRSDLAVTTQPIGGSGELDGSANANGGTINFENSAVYIAGDLQIEASSIGGDSLSGFVFDPQTGAEPSSAGGEAPTFDNELDALNTDLGVGEAIALTNSAMGGNALSGSGGMATAAASKQAGIIGGGNYALDGLVRAFVGAGARGGGKLLACARRLQRDPASG
ncbi:MAG: hypothetical protein HRT64_06705 [Erythrobacter sp.]|nr:hypothetical protein [Erythrobacter sp.]